VSNQTTDQPNLATVLEHLKSKVSPDSFNVYFSGLNIRIEPDGSASVTSPTRHATECLERIYKPEMTDAVRAVYPQLVGVNFCTAARPATESGVQLGAVLDVVRSARGGLSLTDSNRYHSTSHNALPLRGKPSSGNFVHFEPPLSIVFRLENFEVGASNKIAYAAAQTVVETPGSVYCPLYIFGGHGLGKSHLLKGVALGLQSRMPEGRILYTSCETFANGYIAALQSRALDAFRARYRSCDALLIDDIQFLTGKTKTQEELLHTVQFLRSAGKQVVFSANVSPAELIRIEPRLAEVLRSGLSIKVESPEFELRVKLLHALAKRRNWTPAEDALRVLATHIEKSVGELEGALLKTVAIASASGVPASSELALVALRDLGYLRNGPPSLADVLAACSKAMNVSADEMRSSKRVADIAHARHIAMYLAKHLTSHTVAEIGRYFGNRDHSTVLHALKKIGDLAKREEIVRGQLQQIRQLLGK
jgi:chromosomal replication initiator protein